MQAILCVIFAIFSATVFSADFPFLRNRICRSIRPMRNLNEIRHQGPWIVFGGNIRCDDCCLTFDLTLKKPGTFNVRQINHTLSGPGTGTYRCQTGLVYILSSDYTNYHVVYKQPGKFFVLVRSLDVLKDRCTRNKILAAFKRQSQICRLKYYPYNIEEACQNYKPTD